jgi:hypothetical protein
MKLTIFYFVTILLIVNQCQSLRVHNKKGIKNQPTDPIPPFKTFYTTQFLDHFNFRDSRTFQQRYLLNGLYFNYILNFL